MNWGFDWFGWIKTTGIHRHRRGSRSRIVCVMIGQGAERYAGGGLVVAGRALRSGAGETKAETRAAPVFNTIDYATTGSINGQTVVIAPCASQKVEH